MRRFTTHVRMRDTDAAGVIYFANQFTLAHQGFEHYLEEEGLGLGLVFAERDYRFPIVHAEADYRAALRVGDELAIEMTAERVGSTSFTLVFRVFNKAGREVGLVRTVHVAVDRDTWSKRPLPPELRAAVEKLKPGP